jgi:hypothetical protein
MASENKAQPSASTKRAPPPALNPESAALLQPWKDFVSKGLISTLRVEFTPMGVTCSCTVSGSLYKDTDPVGGIPLGEAKSRIIDAKLWTPRGAQGKVKDGPKENLLPKRSLVKADFSVDNIEKLPQRALAIASALGATTARGRIGSLKLMSEGVDTFEKWWIRADPVSKTRIFSDAKHHRDFTAQDHAAFAAVVPGCPFRGSVPTPNPEDGEEDEEPVPPQKRNGSPTTTT